MALDSMKARVLEYFLKNTPVGEHKEVLSNLQAIFGSEVLHTPEVINMILDSLASHGTIISQESLIYQLSPLGRLKGVKFYDPKLAVSFDVDPFNLEISNISTIPSLVFISRIIQEKLDLYIFQHFSETAQGRVFQQGEEILIFVACSSINLKNMWTGE